ncbi:TonB family protein [Archangium sp.]|jgi:protein TonB|uniref:energy transducer TonB n=1 Tax=Archangium sp. TaxID=1872627 RepID=UPI002ED81402
MRTILNFDIGMPGSDTRPRVDVRPSVGLFRMGEAAQADGESGRWGRALLLTVLVHAGLLLAGLSMSGGVVKEAPVREEPELVFFSFPPPPAAAARATSSRAAVAERVQRQARTRLPRPENRAPTPLPTKAPEEPALEQPAEETANLEAVQDEGAPDEAPAEGDVATGTAALGGVVAGLVDGVLDGREGGMVGATGGAALELKQVARAPRVLEQVKPHYPRRAKADGLVGLVLVRVIIGTDGRIEPEHTRVIRSVPGLDAAAITAVSQWRFSPALGHQGRAVRVIVEIPVQFSLK